MAYTRRQMISGTATVLSAFAVSSPVLAQQKTKITAAYGQPNLQNLPIWIAKDAGLFDKYGLDVDLVQLTGPTITQGLVSGSVQFISSSPASVFLARLGGGDTLMVGSTLNKFPQDFIATAKVKTAADLKGKTGAIFQRGDALDTGTRLALKSQGLDMDKDVTIVQGFGTDKERIAAMLSGGVDFAMINIDARPTYTAAGLHRLFSLLDQNIVFTLSGVFTTKSYAQRNPAVVENYMKAIAEALKIFKTDRKKAMEVAVKYMKRPADDILPGYEAYIPATESTPRMDVEYVKTALTALSSARADAANANPEDFYDASFYKKLVESGFFKSIGVND